MAKHVVSFEQSSACALFVTSPIALLDQFETYTDPRMARHGTSFEQSSACAFSVTSPFALIDQFAA
jgi:hypothetical protein